MNTRDKLIWALKQVSSGKAKQVIVDPPDTYRGGKSGTITTVYKDGQKFVQKQGKK